jgi:hypothetical protein
MLLVADAVVHWLYNLVSSIYGLEAEHFVLLLGSVVLPNSPPYIRRFKSL